MKGTLLTTHILDTNVLIDAERRTYPPDIFPGFWDFLASHADSGRIVILDRVRTEILNGTGLLTKWVKERGSTFVVSSKDPLVVAAYTPMVQWVSAKLTSARERGFSKGDH